MSSSVLDGRQRFYRAGSQPGSVIRTSATGGERIEGIDSHHLVPPTDYRPLTRAETRRAILMTLALTAFLVLVVLSFRCHAPIAEHAVRLMGR